MSEQSSKQFKIVRNGDPAPADVDWLKGLEGVQKGIGDALNARNVAFLLGAGCSSLRKNGAEVGIATMQPLAEEFCRVSLEAHVEPAAAEDFDDADDADDADDEADEADEADELEDWETLESQLEPDAVPEWALSKPEIDYLAQVGVELNGEYARNLERLMEVLHSHGPLRPSR